MPAGWIRSIFMAILFPRSRCSSAPRMPLRSRLANHQPGPPMTLGTCASRRARAAGRSPNWIKVKNPDAPMVIRDIIVADNKFRPP